MQEGKEKEQPVEYDAIVIGTGISGGWAAKELCEKGLKTLVLERGRMVRHVVDYPTMHMEAWDFEHRGETSAEDRKRQEKQARTGYTTDEQWRHWFVDDIDHPYTETKRFDWMRGYHVGGRSLTWGRHSYRLGPQDFEANKKDGHGVDWPIRYKDLAPWYDKVEDYIGVCGKNIGSDQIPDGKLTEPMPFNCVEEDFASRVHENMEGRVVTHARVAHITGDKTYEGRGKCQYRDRCMRGCPFGGYFSSNSSTLPWAEKTGNLTMKHHAVVESVIYDQEKQRATGVRVIDAISKESTEYFAKVIFVNASTMNTNLILLNSKSSRFPEGLGNDNGLLGKYVAFHNYRGVISAEYEGMKDQAMSFRQPISSYMPRFRNLYEQETDFLRGYATEVSAGRMVEMNSKGFGTELKNNLLNPKYGNWLIRAQMMGETIPKENNRVSLDPVKKDQWGIPLLSAHVEYDDNDERMIKDFEEQFTEMYQKAGFTNIRMNDSKQAPGLDIHEMGGVRMGRDPKTSLLNEWNQMHACKNVYVTDGACMTSTATQNPSLTYMALTARACDHAIRESKKS
jgi:choline dehydrogenase-like flavoprotein